MKCTLQSCSLCQGVKTFFEKFQAAYIVSVSHVDVPFV